MAQDVLDSQSLCKLRKVFVDVDKDHSGAISLEEFKRACKELSIEVSIEELNDFVESDTSADGQLDFEEFCKFYIKRLRTVFSEMDTDQSGEIGLEELKVACEKLGHKATEREIRAMLREVDVDKNEQISFTEFCNYFCSMPTLNMRMVIEKWASGLSVDTGKYMYIRIHAYTCSPCKIILRHFGKYLGVLQF